LLATFATVLFVIYQRLRIMVGAQNRRKAYWLTSLFILARCPLAPSLLNESALAPPPMRESSVRTTAAFNDSTIRYALVAYSCIETDLDWVTLLPHVPPIMRPSCHLLAPMSERNGCTESHGYLQAVIENYDWLESIADVLIFVHAHRTSWHYHHPVDEQIKTLLLDGRAYLDNNDVGAVYCKMNVALATSEWGPSANMDQRVLWDSIYNGTGIAFPEGPIAYGCCGTFWVKTSAIKRRPLEVYKRVLANTLAQSDIMNDLHICGRVGESSWAILFAGVQVVATPDFCL
jgi:Protein of unknown function (DUF3431)